MKLNSAMLALSLALCACGAGAQTFDLGPDTGGYRRFLLYPHLEKGLAAMARGERRRTLVEFEQARLLAPDNPTVSLHLAAAYRYFGNATYAETVLREQLSRHPGHAGLIQALEELRTRTPAPLAASVASAAKPVAGGLAATRVPSVTRSPAVGPAVAKTTASGPAGMRAPAGLVLLAGPSPQAGAAPVAQRPPGRTVPAHQLAAQAARASARGDHAAAVLAARQAVLLAPANRYHRLLLARELAEIGQLEEADAVLFRTPPAKAAAGSRDDLAAWQRQLHQRIAFKHFEAARQAAAAAQADAALASARQAIRYAPDQLAYRLQLLDLLLAAQQWAEADQSASEAMGTIGLRPALLALRAYALQRSGQREAAGADLDAALAAPDLAPGDQQQLRLIATDAALAAGEAQKALDLLAPLVVAAGADEGVRQRQALALQASSGPALLVLPSVWPSPRVACVSEDVLPACRLWPAETLPNLGHVPAQSADQALGSPGHEDVPHGLAADVESPGLLRSKNVKINFVTSLA